MSMMLRCVLLVASAFSAIWIIWRIRKAKVRLEDTLYWIAMSVILLILGAFPQISNWAAAVLGIQAPSNFIFFAMICLLFEKILTMSILHSQMEDKYVTMVAEMALRCKDLEKRIEELQEQVKESSSNSEEEK